MKRQRVLIFDIETSPMSGHMWRPKTDYIPHNQRLEESFMLTWSAKVWGTGPGTKLQGDFLQPDEVLAKDDRRLVASLADLVRDTDIVIAHNARRFDVPRLNTRLMLQLLEPLTPFKIVDTLELVRKSFDLPYNRLDYLSQVLLGEGKMDTDFDLWRRVMAGDVKAMRYMFRYNGKDVRLLERVFDRTLPYLKGLPRMVRADYDMEMACPICGSGLLHARGHHDTNAQGYQTYQCLKCGHYPRLRKASEPRLALVPTP